MRRLIPLLLVLPVLPVHAEIEASATILAARDVDIAAKTVSRVIDVRADESDRVSRGDVLVVLDNAELKAELAAAEASIALAQAERYRAERAEARARKLYDSGTLPEENFDAAVYARDAAVQQVRSAEARRDLILANLDETELEAPFDGVVTFRDVEAGQLTASGATLMTIEDHGHFLVEFLVKDRDAPKLSSGQPVTVVVDALDGIRLGASIERVIPSGDPATHEFRVEARLDPGPGLLPGMFATVLIPD